MWSKAYYPDMAGSIRKVVRFGFASISLILVWTIVLPWMSAKPPVAKHLRWLDQAGIDGGAMFYTELEAMDPILQRLNNTARFGKQLNK
jgi:hypothetical protein